MVLRKLLGMTGLLLFSLSCCAASKAVLITINEAIGPATQDYIERGVDYANKQHAAALIIRLNTPGGLETAMRGINEAIITSSVPVISYVAPSGARAASAGTFIMYASNIAAMAPGTNIGAASPVAMGVGADEEKKAATSLKKAKNDAAAYMRSLAQLRGRNADWGALAVTKAESISAEEAYKLKVIDLIAKDYDELLTKADGRTTMIHNVATQINTKGASIEHMPTDWRHEFLSFITNPNIAYILMLIAMYGIFFELSNPGAILPGVAGIIALLLVFYAFQLLPVNYVGLTLLLLGVAFMIAEIYVSSFGALGIGGALAFIVGSIMLFDSTDGTYRISWSIIGVMSAVTIAFFLAVATLVIRSHRRAITTGREALIGTEGIVISVADERIMVQISGELWEAKSKSLLKVGEHVKVINIHGLVLEVKGV